MRFLVLLLASCATVQPSPCVEKPACDKGWDEVFLQELPQAQERCDDIDGRFEWSICTPPCRGGYKWRCMP